MIEKLLDRWQSLRDAIDVDLIDIHTYGGIAVLAVGAERIYPGVGWLLAGLALFYIGVRPGPPAGPLR